MKTDARMCYLDLVGRIGFTVTDSSAFRLDNNMSRIIDVGRWAISAGGLEQPQNDTVRKAEEVVIQVAGVDRNYALELARSLYSHTRRGPEDELRTNLRV